LATTAINYEFKFSNLKFEKQTFPKSAPNTKGDIIAII